MMHTKKKTITIALALILLIVIGSFGWTAIAKNRQEQERLRIEQEQELARQEAELQAQREEEARIAAEQARIEDIKNKLRAGNPAGEDLKVVFLTFDDGPDVCSNEVLDILQANNVKATFFANGHTGEGMDDVYRRIVAEGHTLANHTWSHSYNLYAYPEAFLNDITQLEDYERQVTGVEPTKLFRFPGGSNMTTQANVDAVLAKGYRFFDWTATAGDGANIPLSPEEVISKIRSEMSQHYVNVILCHAERPEKDWSRAALDPLIKQLLAEGYTFLPLDPSYEIPDARFM